MAIFERKDKDESDEVEEKEEISSKTQELEQVTKTQESSDGSVVIPSKSWEELLSQVAELKKTNDMLTQVADKGALARYYAQQSDAEITRKAKLSIINGKVVVGWGDIVKDEVGKNTSTGNYFERQVVEVYYEGGESEQLEYIDFVRLPKKEWGDIVNSYTTPDGKDIVTMKIFNREIDVERRFLN